MMCSTILYVFAGRKPNLEIAVPFYRRLTELNPDLEIHVWDLARRPEDSEYIRSITGERITVRTEFYNPPYTQRGQNRVWKYYAQPDYKDTVFIKTDDDVLFMDTARLPALVNAAENHPGSVVSALTINNGASTPLVPELWAGFQKLNIPLLDVHLTADYGEMCHRWFFDHWTELTRQPLKLTPTRDWLSINCIAYTYDTGRQIFYRMRRLTGGEIAGRRFGRHYPGDEGAVNLLPRLILQGVTAAHLTFGPQHLDDGLLAELRKHYADIAHQHLCR
jgi:hypothetical protein